MFTHKPPTSPLSVTIKEPLDVELVVKVAATGVPLLSLGEHRLAPGESLHWDYPVDGLTITAD